MTEKRKSSKVIEKLKSDNVKIEKTYTAYDITSTKMDVSIKAQVKSNGEVSIFRKDGQKDFIFKSSKPELIYEIARLVMIASQIKEEK